MSFTSVSQLTVEPTPPFGSCEPGKASRPDVASTSRVKSPGGEPLRWPTATRYDAPRSTSQASAASPLASVFPQATASYSDRMWRTTATAASRSPDACTCTTSRGAFPGATVYQTVPAARPQPLGSFESVVAPSVEPVTFVASVPYGAAWPRVSFAGGKNSFAVSSNAPSVVDR